VTKPVPLAAPTLVVRPVTGDASKTDPGARTALSASGLEATEIAPSGPEGPTVVEDAEKARSDRDQAKAAAEDRAQKLARRAVVDRELGAPIFVPAAEVTIGADDLGNDEAPAHRVPVAAFELDATEVTVAAYGRCVAEGKCGPASRGPGCNGDVPGLGAHPTNCVDWNQAKHVCAWAGKRLPTEESGRRRRAARAGAATRGATRCRRASLAGAAWIASRAAARARATSAPSRGT
jgi:formylglycine-generating enzyme required for sulfatase activity